MVAAVKRRGFGDQYSRISTIYAYKIFDVYDGRGVPGEKRDGVFSPPLPRTLFHGLGGAEKRSVLVKVLPRMIVKRWAFDLEMLTIANRVGFKRIYESPVEISSNFMSNVGLSSVQNFFIDYLAIIYRTYILHYYDDDGSDHWEGDPHLKLRYK